MSILAALLIGTAVGALVRPTTAGVRRLAPARPVPRRSDRRRRTVATILPAMGLAVGAVAGMRALVSLFAVGAIAWLVTVLRSQQQRRASAAACRARVIEACGVLAADLRAGRTVQDALDGAATVCPELGPAVATARLGGDVGAVLDEAAAAPGAGGLRTLGAAWRVSEQSGAAFAAVVERLSHSLRADESTRRQVSAGLGGTRATARLLAGLPLLGTLLGYAIGADPLAFLTGSPIGWVCLIAGITLGGLGLLWVERLAGACEADR